MRARRIAVIHPPVSVARDFIDYPYLADLGAVQLAAVLRDAGHAVTLVDAYALPGSSLTWRDDDRAHLGAPVTDVLASVPPVDAIIVALTPFHRPPHRDDVLAALLVGLGRDHAAPIVLADAYQSGQHYVDTDDGAVLAAYPEARAHVKYEAEVAIPALLATEPIAAGTHRGSSPVLADLPFPAWDLVDLAARDRFSLAVMRELGRGRWEFPIDGRTLPMVTSRGCPFTCAHCSSNPGRLPGEPKLQRRYPPERLAAYLAAMVRDHGATRLAVLDELINVNAAHFDHFLDAISALDIAFELPNGLRADYLEPRHLGRMRGKVTTVSVSAESGSQRVLDDSVGKRLDLAEIRRVAADAQRAAVPLLIHYMIGLPGETAEEINQTLELALTLHDDHGAIPAVQFATPLPGTRLAPPTSRALPVIADWGPHFQRGGDASLSQVGAATLRTFMATFRERLAASAGPQKLIMNVTYVCNNHCTFCAVGTRTQLDGHPVRQREHLAKYRRHGVHMVDFDGGEPTMNPELVPLVRYARAIGYDRINVTTNGRMCAYPEFAAKLVRSGLTTLLFSVHGASARSHDREVGVAEAFDQTVLGIQHCVAAAPPGVELGMNVTITKHNADEIPAIGDLALALGLRWINLQFLTPFGRATARHAPDTQAAADIVMRFIDSHQARMKIQVINLPFCHAPGYERFLAGDLNKLRRHMVFVNNETVNLADYLAEHRVHRAVCAPCPHRCFCGGFYELGETPEPPWLVSVESLVRRVDPELDRGLAPRVGTQPRES